MSVVAIPFKDEDPRVVLANLATAAGHPRVERVWAIGESPEVADAAPDGVEVFAEERLGDLRPGKGDAMNTAIARAASESLDRLHFYDADITNFDAGWIDGAEAGADLGFEVVRHTFHRAATDAMITWFITRPMLALRFPESLLPRIGQPLGGELLLTTDAIATMAADPDVVARSDWGIDTLLTHGTVAAGFSLFEHHVGSGKEHALYGSLSDISVMALECFDAVNRLPGRPVPAVRHRRDPDLPPPRGLTEVVAYSMPKSLGVLTAPWAEGEKQALSALPDSAATVMERAMATGEPTLMDEEFWWEFLKTASGRFLLGDTGWESLLLRGWTGRVIEYTTTHASRGFDHAMEYLSSTIDDYVASANRRL